MRTIQSKWKEYKKMVVLPENPSEEEIVDAQMAFYAGATIMLHYMLEIGDDNISEDSGIAIIDGFSSEINNFVPFSDT